ncbi:10319_t:CDS:1, partial [Cetraspora pellucida]
NEAVEIICHSKRVFTDFRSKFNKSIAELVHEFKERGLGEQISTPSRLDINEFITHEVGERLLKRYLSGTNKDKLRRCGTMDTLIKLIKEAFKIFFTAYDTKAIKRLDNLTIGCRIP